MAHSHTARIASCGELRVAGDETLSAVGLSEGVDLGAVLDAWPECARILTLTGEIEYIKPKKRVY